jgi:hypothetical protein
MVMLYWLCCGGLAVVLLMFQNRNWKCVIGFLFSELFFWCCFFYVVAFLW